MLELMTLISDQYKIPLKRRIAKEHYLPSPISVNQPDLQKLSALGFTPRFSVQEGFQRMICWAEETYGR